MLLTGKLGFLSVDHVLFAIKTRSSELLLLFCGRLLRLVLGLTQELLLRIISFEQLGLFWLSSRVIFQTFLLLAVLSELFLRLLARKLGSLILKQLVFGLCVQRRLALMLGGRSFRG
jgi:hypothetical protein